MSDEDRSTRAREIYDQYLGPNAEQPLADLEPPLAPKVLKEIAASFKGGKLLHKDVFKPVIRAFKETWLQVEAGNWKKTPEGAAMLKTMSEQIIKTYAMFYKDDEGEVKKLCLVGFILVPCTRLPSADERSFLRHVCRRNWPPPRKAPKVSFRSRKKQQAQKTSSTCPTSSLS
jgi:hypothetical protein